MKFLTNLFLVTLFLVGSFPARGDIITGKYWFDTDVNTVDFTPGSFSIATDGLSDGLHVLNLYVSQDGVNSSTVSKWFVKYSAPVAESYRTDIFVDGKAWETSKANYSDNGTIPLSLDMSKLPLGIHILEVQLVANSTGQMVDNSYAMFMCVDEETSSPYSPQGYYLIDNSIRGDLKVNASGSIGHFDLDCSLLSTGIHSANLYLTDSKGVLKNSADACFVKMPLGGNGVKSYEYWINSNQEDSHKFTLETPEDPFTLIDLLNLNQEPFRSSSYTLTKSDGKLFAYAVNDFQLQFLDGEYGVSMGSKSFTDMRVKKEVTDVTPLENHEDIILPSLNENDMKWYSFEGESGDSISIKLNRGGLYEVWTPCLNKLVAKYGADAVNHYGTTLSENGTYYIAAHDLTYRNGTQLTFNHIPRLSIIGNTPQKAANSEYLVVDVQGNGFDHLESITLKSEMAELTPTEYNVKDRYNLSLMFKLDPATAPIGKYDLVALFKEEGKDTETVTKEGAVEIVATEKSNIVTSITPSNIGQRPYEVYLDITNNSDQSVWGVPVNFAVAKTNTSVQVAFKDFYIHTGEEEINMSEKYISTDNLLGTGMEGVICPMVVPYLGPRENLRLTVGLESNSSKDVRMYFWNGTPWSEDFAEMLSEGYDFEELEDHKDSNILTAKTMVYLMSTKDQATPDSISSAKNISTNPKRPLRNAANMADHAANISQASGMAIGGYINGLRLRGAYASLEAAGYDINDPDNPIAGYVGEVKAGMPTPGHIISTAMGRGEIYEIAQNHIRNCNSNPLPQTEPTDITPRFSVDPNDMHGYISPSGDIYIGRDVKTIEYSIEFENDPKFANANASRITVDNTLMKDRFDLSSFKPVSMKIGDKEMELPAEHHFTVTMDMRPDVGSVAELTFDYDATTGESSWKIRSLDPLTMDETKYVDDGVLPVNDENGRGIGYLTYQIDLLPTLSDDTSIGNFASIVFDDNDPIETPVYTNITDYTLPDSKIVERTTDDNQTFNFTVEGSDKGSGIWMYDLYVRPANSNRWILAKAGIEDNSFTYVSDEKLDGASFAVLAIDRAGNRQDESTLKGTLGDADGNGSVDINDVVSTVNYYTKVSDILNITDAEVTGDGVIDIQDVTQIRNIYLGNSTLE